MDLRAAHAAPGAVQPKGLVSFSEAGRGWSVRWRASSQAQNPVKSPRQDFSTFLAPVRVPQCRRQGSGISNREPRRGGGRRPLLRVVLLRDTVRCHSRLGVFGGLNLYPPIRMGRPSTRIPEDPHMRRSLPRSLPPSGRNAIQTIGHRGGPAVADRGRGGRGRGRLRGVAGTGAVDRRDGDHRRRLAPGCSPSPIPRSPSAGVTSGPAPTPCPAGRPSSP